MKKILSVICSLTLAAVMSFSAILPCFAAELPAGVTREDALAAIPKLESLVKTLMSQNEMTSDLSGTVYGMLYSDATLNSLLTGVYSAFAENESTFSGIGLDISVSAVAEELKAYPEVYEFLCSKQSWSEVLGSPMTCRWNIDTADGFKHALAGMFGPMNPLLYTLLCGGRYKVSPIIFIDGDAGYQNAIVPILNALSCPSVMSQEEFTAQAKQNRYYMMRNIVSMLFAAIDDLLSAPVEKLCTVLPGLAYFIQNGGITNSLETLISPLKVRVGLLQMSGLDKILSSSGMLSDAGSLTDLLAKADLSALTGSDMQLKMPEIDLAALAACGSVSGGTFVPDKTAALCEIMHWALRLFRMNQTELLSALGGGIPDGASGFLDGLLAKSDDELIKFIFDILNMSSDDTVLEYEWKYPAFTPGTVQYTPNLGVTEYTKVLSEIDATLNEFMTEFGDGSLSSSLATAIYSNSLVTTLVKTLYGALYSEETAPVLGMLGLDASPEGISEVISGSYRSASRSISAALKWENVNENTVSWGFSNGSRQGFEKALMTVLRPLTPFLELLLAEGETELFEVIRIKGSNGYNTAVIPLLEALGCHDVQAYSQYKAASGTDDALKFILDPVCGLIDELIEKPVATICEKLPNIVYFVNSGGIKQCVDNLLYPVNVLLKKFGMENMLPDSLSSIGEVDIAGLITQLSENGTLPFKLPAPDLTLLGSLGTAEQYDSKRTYKGLYTDCTYIRADAPAVLVTVLRYVIGALSDPANGDGLSSLMGGDAMAGNDMFAMYAGNITEQFKTMSTDEIIEWLYNLLFRETPKKEIVEKDDDYIPTVIYEPEKDYATLKKTVLIIAVIVIPTLLVVYLAKRDVNDKKERRQRKKLKKKAAKQAARSGKKTIPAGRTVPAAGATVKPAAAETASVKTPSKAAGAVKKAGSVNVAVSAGLISEKERAREEARLISRQNKAVKKAMRDARKADKYYEEALRQHSKRR